MNPPSASATYHNPVLPWDFADPFVLRVQDRYFAYATNAGGFDSLGDNVQVSRSSDLSTWAAPLEALPLLPRWARRGRTWAPEVLRHEDGTYRMYYTAWHAKSRMQAIGVAYAHHPEGPFIDASHTPLVFQKSGGGSIDASPFQDADGQRYLLWKNDGNHVGVACFIWIQKLSDDGMALEGEPRILLEAAQGWEKGLIEAPTLHLHAGHYYLFYSAASFADKSYAVGYAVSRTLEGPFERISRQPLLESGEQAIGPGHQSVFTDEAGQPWMVYHAWSAGRVGYPRGQRSMRIDPLEWELGQHGPDVPCVQMSTEPRLLERSLKIFEGQAGD